MANKDFLVTVNVHFRRSYIVNAADWEHAEDYAIDETWGDMFNPGDDDCEIEAVDVELA